MEAEQRRGRPLRAPGLDHGHRPPAQHLQSIIRNPPAIQLLHPSSLAQTLPHVTIFASGINKRDEDKEHYSRLKRGVPTLHFISMSVFQGADYDPLFVIEANFDGRPGPFWAQMEATLGDVSSAHAALLQAPLG